uniref:Aquaporin n=1 Tax=Panagrolaimus sp. ES5 TaxID=591445 RepID=A0AC34F6R6_9BILA
MTEKIRLWLHKNVVDRMRIQNEMARQFLAEFIGTAFLLLIGTAANVQAKTAVTGNSTSEHLAWGFGFMFAVYLSANISGAHLNPAISLMFWIQGDMGFLRMLVYWVAQYLGGIFGSLVSFLGHYDDVRNYGKGHWDVAGPNATAGLFAPYPTEHLTHVGAFFDQLIGTAILSAMILLITDKRNSIPPTQIPMLAGVTMMMIAMTFGDNGFSINPARDIGPRVWQVIMYGGEVFSSHDWYFWIPVIGPHVGAPIGAWIYKLFIGLHGEQMKNSGDNDKRGYKVMLTDQNLLTQMQELVASQKKSIEELERRKDSVISQPIS